MRRENTGSDKEWHVLLVPCDVNCSGRAAYLQLIAYVSKKRSYGKRSQAFKLPFPKKGPCGRPARVKEQAQGEYLPPGESVLLTRKSECVHQFFM